MSEAARFLAALSDADADGVTVDEIVDWLEEHADAGELLRLRVGCLALLGALNQLAARRRRELNRGGR